MKRVIMSADDFGMSLAVNEAVEHAHRAGILASASLMVAGTAATDAVRRARAMPSLRVGLHLVLVEGPAVLPPAAIPGLVDRSGRFGSDQAWRGVRYFFAPAIRRQLAAEIGAQFEAFRATGLPLDHVNAHKHMHLHPTVGALACRIGRDFGARAIRVPAEPPRVMAACGERIGAGGRALHAWSTLLRTQARKAGLLTNDHVFGLAWSGHMTAPRLLRLAAHLPEGVSELYFHPAARRDPLLDALMPGYEHEAELAALLDPEVARALDAAGVERTSYGTLAG